MMKRTKGIGETLYIYSKKEVYNVINTEGNRRKLRYFDDR
jgi:hypothetical protein